MARTDNFWQVASTGYISPIDGTNSLSLILSGSNKYINFNTLTGSSGYGIRDNGGTMQFKNNGGAWTAFGSGGGGGGGGGGDMYISTYDPTGVSADAFARANHTGTQPISTISGLSTALSNKSDVGHTHVASDITDFSTASDARISAAAGVTLATLSGGKVPSSQLPAIAVTDVFTVASQSAQLALTAEEGDIAIRSDLNKSYVHNGGTAGTMADWSELLTPTDTVLSINGEVGVVTLTTDDISDTSQTNKWATATEKTKLGFITVTQAVNLDTMESDITGKATAGAVGSSGITMSTAKILGRTTASTGAIEEITVGTGLSLTSGTLTANAYNISLEFMSGLLTIDFYAPYAMNINTVTNVLNTPTTTILVGGSAYTLGTAITLGSLITVTVSTASVIRLNATK